MPMNRSGRLVSAASSVIEIEEVLLARITPGPQYSVRFFQHADFQVELLGDGFNGEIRGGESVTMSVVG